MKNKLPKDLEAFYLINGRYTDLYVDTIYHYTSPAGILGIIENKKLNFRLSDARFLNDYSEGSEIEQLVVSVTKELLAENKVSEKYVSSMTKLLDIFLKKTTFVYHKENGDSFAALTTYSTYILSFSKDQDSLPMWNYYTKDNKYEGYNIGIDSKIALISDLNNIQNGFSMFSHEVIYDNQLKREQLKSILSQLANYEEQHPGETWGQLSFVLWMLRFLYKSPAFAHEREVRLILQLTDEPAPKGFNGHPFEIKYREANGYIIPYVEVALPEEYLNSITIGPLIAQQEAKQSLQKFLKSRGYNNVEINCSNVPVRY